MRELQREWIEWPHSLQIDGKLLFVFQVVSVIRPIYLDDDIIKKLTNRGNDTYL